jgi:phage terminase large subunit
MPRLEDIITLQPKQQQALAATNKYRYIYYGGARGGGKTHAACAIAIHYAIRFPGVSIVIMRHTIEEIKQYIVPTIEYILPERRWKTVYKFDRRDKQYVFKNGSRIYLRPLRNEADVQSEQGIERNIYILDEANNIVSDHIRKLDGSLRNTRVPKLKPFMFMTGNPGGISDDYFLSHFVKPDYSRWSEPELELKDEYCFIPATVYDNEALIERDPDYVRTLQALPANLRSAWLEGRWDVFSGQFFEEWNEEYNTVQDFDIPPDWPRYRTIDLGKGSHPSVCYWIAQSPVDNRYYVYREFCFKGSVDDFVRGIKQLSLDVRGCEEYILRTFADPTIFARDNQYYDVEQYFRAEGIMLERSINDRILGWRVMKQWMHWTIDEDGTVHYPALRIFRGACPEALRYLPLLRYSNFKDDCDTRSVDDHADALRYFCIMMPHPEPAEVVEPERPVVTLANTVSPREVQEAVGRYFSDKQNLYFCDDEDLSVYVSPYIGI